jgi:Uma2 family endonuclease
MAVTPAERIFIDDSEYEMCLNGQLRRRPVPGQEHAALQLYFIEQLRPATQKLGGRVLQEWSLSDGEHWLTPDVMMSGVEYRLTRRGHLWAPPPPHLVIEIRSVDQSVRNLFDKIEDYREYHVPYYWIVDPIDRGCYEALMAEPEISVRVIPRSSVLKADFVRVEIPPLWDFLERETR